MFSLRKTIQSSSKVSVTKSWFYQRVNCEPMAISRLPVRCLRSFTKKGVDEPAYLDYLKPQVPYYPLINVQVGPRINRPESQSVHSSIGPRIWFCRFGQLCEIFAQTMQQFGHKCGEGLVLSALLLQIRSAETLIRGHRHSVYSQSLRKEYSNRKSERKNDTNFVGSVDQLSAGRCQLRCCRARPDSSRRVKIYTRPSVGSVQGRAARNQRTIW